MKLLVLSETFIPSTDLPDLSPVVKDYRKYSSKRGPHQLIKELNAVLDRELVVISDIPAAKITALVNFARKNGSKTLFLSPDPEQNLVRPGIEAMFVDTDPSKISDYLKAVPALEIRKDQEPLYISVVLDSDALLALRSVVNKKLGMGVGVGVDLSVLKEYLHHVTLMHSNSLDFKSLKHWNTLKELKDTEMEIKVLALHHTNNAATEPVEGVVFSVSLGQHDSLVFSGIPHITGWLPKKVAPVESIRYLKEDLLTKIELTPPLVIKGRVTLH